MNPHPYILFVYAKSGRIQCLNNEDARIMQLDKNGWTHTATINAARWIEEMANGHSNPSDMLDELQFSKTEK